MGNAQTKDGHQPTDEQADEGNYLNSMQNCCMRMTGDKREDMSRFMRRELPSEVAVDQRRGVKPFMRKSTTWTTDIEESSEVSKALGALMSSCVFLCTRSIRACECTRTTANSDTKFEALEKQS
jgi:hypothetical protein